MTDLLPTRDEVLIALRAPYGADDLEKARETARLVDRYLDDHPEALLDLELGSELEGFHLLLSAIEGVSARATA